MEYTIQELAKIAGVTSRTLRYYDEIDLLKPKRINSSGYRIYGLEEVDLLQQILFYRELGLPLTEIKKLIYESNFNPIEALKKHRSELLKKRSQLDLMIRTIDKTIQSKEGGIPLQDEEKFACFKETMIEENEAAYGDEVRDKFGKRTLDASNSKLRNMTQKDYEQMKKLEEEIFHLLKRVAEHGDPTSSLAQKLASKHKEWLLYTWQDYSKEAHARLVEMYVQDKRFASYYDKHVKNGAKFLRNAVLHHLGKK